MKANLFAVAAAAVLLSAPLASFAQQSDAPVTRAEVRAQLAQAEQAGFKVSGADNLTYPSDAQAAETKIAAANDAAPAATQTGFGPSLSSQSQSGTHAVNPSATKSLYFGQ